MDGDTIDTFSSQCMAVYYHDGNEKTPLYAKNDSEKAVLKIIVGFCLVFCIGILIILLIDIHYGSHQLVPHGNVASDNAECSQYGIDVLQMGGNAVDAAITTVLCNSVALPHLSGLGGSGVMIIYDHRTSIGYTIDFRATLSSSLSIGVPGFLAGLSYASFKFGILPWKTLVKPSINLVNKGIIVTESLLEGINQNSNVQDENLKLWMKKVLTKSPGQLVEAPNGLNETLNLIYSQGSVEFYKRMSQELKPILKTEDVTGFQPFISPVLKDNFMNYSIITSNEGTGGPILIDVLKQMNDTYEELSILRSFKNLKNDWYENHGLHVSTTDTFDLYVTVTSGLGSIFGSRILTSSGYILNNFIDLSFKNQEIHQTDRAFSLYLPFIVVETEKLCGRRLISGSTDVRDGVQILLSMLKSDPQDILSVNNITRFHFKNNDIAIESKYFNKLSLEIAEIFKKSGYNVSNASLPYPTSNIVQKVEDVSIAFSDSRGIGHSFTL